MEKCEKGYGKHCFECKSEKREFTMVATGEGISAKVHEPCTIAPEFP